MVFLGIGLLSVVTYKGYRRLETLMWFSEVQPVNQRCKSITDYWFMQAHGGFGRIVDLRGIRVSTY
jgi:hypothetical protein